MHQGAHNGQTGPLVKLKNVPAIETQWEIGSADYTSSNDRVVSEDAANMQWTKVNKTQMFEVHLTSL